MVGGGGGGWGWHQSVCLPLTTFVAIFPYLYTKYIHTYTRSSCFVYWPKNFHVLTMRDRDGGAIHEMRAGDSDYYNKYQQVEPSALTRKTQTSLIGHATQGTGNIQTARFGRVTCRRHQIQPFTVVHPQSSSGLDKNTVNTTLRTIH